MSASLYGISLYVLRRKSTVALGSTGMAVNALLVKSFGCSVLRNTEVCNTSYNGYQIVRYSMRD